MKNHTLLRGLAAAWLVTAIVGCQMADDNSVEPGEKSGLDVQVALDALPSARVIDVDKSGIPNFVVGRLGRVELSNDLAAPESQASIRRIVEAVAPVFRAEPQDLVFSKAHTDNIGDQHFRFKQYRNELEVLGGEIVVHVRDGLVTAANGSARADLSAPDVASIAHDQAIDKAKEALGEISSMNVENSRLAYRLSGDHLDLVYVVRVTGEQRDSTPVVDDVLVSAVDGSIVDRISHIHTAKNRSVYNLNHKTALPGTLARSEGGAAANETDVDTNYNLLGLVYDCYKNLFGRDSYNNGGALLKSSVHYSNNYVNAYWNGTQMVYGDGDGVNASSLARSFDVTGHELTHAVTSSESNLTYSGESGGLNESMSDIFGNVCEWYRDGAVSANTWKVGEDCWTPGTSGDALRYMNNPSQDGSSLDYWTSSAGSVDVHYSSGISNLAFYLLSQGGTHPKGKSTINVTGIGIAKAAQIFYLANTSYMTASTNFAGAKTATEQAAAALGYTAAEQASVTAAWQAVGVGVTGGGGGGGTTVLVNGTPVTGISDSTGGLKYYTLDVTSGSSNLSFAMSGGTGDADLYVKFGSQPTTTSYDCRPYKSGNSESCNFASPQTGKYYVMIRAYSTYSGVSLTGSYTAGGGGGGGSCAHDKCTSGSALTSGCDSCVTSICAADSYCCTTSWDSICVGEVSSVCGLTCP